MSVESKLKREKSRGVYCVDKRKAGRVDVELTRLVEYGYLTVVGKASILYWHKLKQVLEELVSLCTNFV